MFSTSLWKHYNNIVANISAFLQVTLPYRNCYAWTLRLKNRLKSRNFSQFSLDAKIPEISWLIHCILLILKIFWFSSQKCLFLQQSLDRITCLCTSSDWCWLSTYVVGDWVFTSLRPNCIRLLNRTLPFLSEQLHF